MIFDRTTLLRNAQLHVARRRYARETLNCPCCDTLLLPIDAGLSAPYVVGSATSERAARRVTRRVSGLRRKVYDFIEQRGEHGATDEEVRDVLKMPESTARPRRIELTKMNYVGDSGRERQVRSGDTATVHVALQGPIPPDEFPEVTYWE